MFEIGAMVVNVIILALEMPCAFCTCYTGVSNVDNLCTSGGLHNESMETVDPSALWAWMAGAFQMVDACGITDISAVASVRRSDESFLWRKLDSQPLW